MKQRIIFQALAIKGSKQAFGIKQKYYSDYLPI